MTHIHEKPWKVRFTLLYAQSPFLSIREQFQEKEQLLIRLKIITAQSPLLYLFIISS